jgi:prevent-host-death family protein
MWRELLDAVEHKGEHVTVLRYDRPAAVVVPVEWYEQAQQALSEERS